VINLIVTLVRDDQGQDLIEYAILIGLITVGTVAVVGQIGTWTAGRFTALDTALTAAS